MKNRPRARGSSSSFLPFAFERLPFAANNRKSALSLPLPRVDPPNSNRLRDATRGGLCAGIVPIYGPPARGVDPKRYASWRASSRSTTFAANSSELNFARKSLAPTFLTMSRLNTPLKDVCSSTNVFFKSGSLRTAVVKV